MRYERKFRLEGQRLFDIKKILHRHPARFRIAFPNRTVNNLYLDSPELWTFYQNVYGLAHRKKYRLRWYGPTRQPLITARFEIKGRRNQLGYKNVATFSSKEDIQAHSHIVDELKSRFTGLDSFWGSLINSYQRAYYTSADGHFRITLDWELKYEAVWQGGSFHQFHYRDNALILELKYAAAMDEQAREVLKYLPFRVEKHSKYVQGILLSR